MVTEIARVNVELCYKQRIHFVKECVLTLSEVPYTKKNSLASCPINHIQSLTNQVLPKRYRKQMNTLFIVLSKLNFLL